MKFDLAAIVQILQIIIPAAVSLAQLIFGQDKGAEKKAAVIEYVDRVLPEAPPEMVERMLEGTVGLMKSAEWTDANGVKFFKKAKPTTA